MSESVTSVLLFTRDLRVHDHPALVAAADGPVVPLFVVDPSLIRRSPNRAWFLRGCLEDLDASLRARGARLVIREGDPATQAGNVARAVGASRIVLTSDVSTYSRRREEALLGTGLDIASFGGHAVAEPGDLAPAGGTHYKVFTPYHRAWEGIPRRRVLPAPTQIDVPTVDEGPRPGDLLPGEPAAPDALPGGETHARSRMSRYLSADLADYDDVRNDAAADRTSRLSVYLRFGCISPNELCAQAAGTPGADAFIRQVAWRDFFFQLLAADPALAWRDLRPNPQQETLLAADTLSAWREGRTGLPLVDAGMRQLLREGFIHNRIRMVVGSFLTRRLGIPWQEGMAHFDRHLLDGDVANDAGNWQWVAGTGTDPRRSRVLNPVRQARRFDPDGTYVRRYVDELRDVPTPAIFAPWKDPDLLSRTGYPPPLVEVAA